MILGDLAFHDAPNPDIETQMAFRFDYVLTMGRYATFDGPKGSRAFFCHDIKVEIRPHFYRVDQGAPTTFYGGTILNERTNQFTTDQNLGGSAAGILGFTDFKEQAWGEMDYQYIPPDFPDIYPFLTVTFGPGASTYPFEVYASEYYAPRQPL